MQSQNENDVLLNIIPIFIPGIYKVRFQARLKHRLMKRVALPHLQLPQKTSNDLNIVCIVSIHTV